MNFNACLGKVYNRGNATQDFLETLVNWARSASDELFAPNSTPVDIFTFIKSTLATPVGKDPSGTPVYHWDSLLHRKAAMLEAMRVHAGFESSWNWTQGVDTKNKQSMEDPRCEETGIFQLSFNITGIHGGALLGFARQMNIDTPDKFIPAMKQNHALCLEMYARAVRLSIAWAGPMIHTHGTNSIIPWLSRPAMSELENLLGQD